ncbi:FHA domain-containing protein [Synechococcus sp. PCC 7502]|uniref:FHA domain-containing protein n=1 Tax=Synechococcus sp. PCC 7502 TaxID=1173263 RepID=UPI00029F8C24|nr:FHA domain-containing protein [Synechococcus sp. PCC 7502]AFY73240.1 FHA domain-containing protein [Synechococcus sp. PCC 7502]
MITLHLLHPTEKTPMQKWSFESEPVIRIGRVEDNHVILYSSVVSRHHAELRRQPRYWEIVGLGANGTFINGEKISQAKITSGTIIRLANSGPRIQIFLDASENEVVNDENVLESQSLPSERKNDPAKERRTFLAPRLDR